MISQWVKTTHGNVPRRGRAKPFTHFDGRCLSRTIRAEDDRHFTMGGIEACVVDSAQVAIGHDKIFDDHTRHASHTTKQTR